MPIVILPRNLSSQISSGEIIERPSCVIKEIVENSIDAGSKNINITVEKSGFQYISVTDDGCGIKKKELLLAITHHATSKITSLLDLKTISTFGFRGEALASIRAVSRLTLISCTQHSDVAWKIYSERFINNNILLQPIAHPQGTTVIVENLFYNIPVRLKFIQNKKLEFLKIFEVIKKIALSHVEINFSLIHNNKLITRYYAINKNKKTINNQNNYNHRLKEIFHELDVNQLIEINSQKNNVFLFGWTFYTEDISKQKKIQYCYINNRFVYNHIVINAFRKACNKIIGNNKMSFILYFQIPSDCIDVNIHPTKKEIKFHNPCFIYQFIYETIVCNLVELKKKYLLNTKHILYKEDTIKDHRNYIMNASSIKYNFSLVKLLIIIRKYYGLVYYNNNLYLLSLPLAKGIIRKNKFIKNIKQKNISDITLINIKISSIPQEYIILFENKEILLQVGFNLIFKTKYVILRSIPCFLKKYINYIILHFFNFLFLRKKISISEIINWFYLNIFIEKKNWNYTNGIAVISEIEYCYPLLLTNPPLKLLQKINIDTVLYTLKI
ncbi:DNA mismatch repair endonuclease MutL [Buchnera aphidicola]|uniref:DNA mismatch repair protein MutL n=1 Tax=Buchnera aphidicola (Artemisaphis artemisicola) TaxID=1241836 RepID=A0A4D6XM15_9GAMM|nr:DNA mismatch repair endonuclease MutL [Buchnera aphidicola]QCI16214.1 DNA mismatch repair endonuclease MutL [Buchnera aphidicola (Artemisaphis artemisicola)]